MSRSTASRIRKAALATLLTVAAPLSAMAEGPTLRLVPGVGLPGVGIPTPPGGFTPPVPGPVVPVPPPALIPTPLPPLRLPSPT